MMAYLDENGNLSSTPPIQEKENFQAGRYGDWSTQTYTWQGS